MFSLYVFDLDGTLVDSRRDIADSANLLLESSGARALPEDVIGRMVGDGAATLVARAFEAVGAAPPPDALERYLAIYETRLLHNTRPYPGIDDVLGAIGGRASLAVLTNKPLAATRRILDGLNLARHFDEAAVLGGDGPFPRKPDPAGLLSLVQRAGATPGTTVMVGDSVIDFRTARHAATSIWMAAYGFGFERFPTGELAPDDRLIDRPGQLLAP